MNSKSRLLCLFVLLSLKEAVNGQLVGESCVRDYDDAPGKCVAVRDCKQAREDYRKGIPLTQCGFIGGKYIICCPDEVATTTTTTTRRPSPGKRISELKCDEFAELTYGQTFVNTLSLGAKPSTLKTLKCNDTTGLIVGGMKTKTGEFPHMAAIGWELQDGNIDFKCGGSLISERFVLSAAHCVPARDPPTMVRLGDQNIFSTNDLVIELDVKISEWILHEGYERGKNDIAVLKLVHDVKFTDLIRPACLWQSADFISDRVSAAGWGKTEFGGGSDELLKVGLDIIDNQECQRLWRQGGIPSFTISDTQMCAGDKRGGKDTCGGDSGGPIMFTRKDNNCLFYIVGVTSFGVKDCGKAGYAGVYSRVSSYLDWIESKVWL